MQGITLRNNLFDANHFKCYKVNQIPEKPPRQKNFVNGLQNARNILKDLERSIQQTSSYEQKLLQCKKSHAHLHRSQEWWELDQDEVESRSSETETATPSRNQVDLPDSWSTVSIVCLQYQYEELSNRYSSLLRAYDERCSALSARERSLSRLRARTRDALAQLVCAHSALLGVGERYLALRGKRREQNSRNEARIRGLKTALRRVLCSAECARLDLDQELGRKMVGERDASKAILLAEMRKCNRLCLENMQLKTKIEDISLGFFGQ